MPLRGITYPFLPRRLSARIGCLFCKTIEMGGAGPLEDVGTIRRDEYTQ